LLNQLKIGKKLRQLIKKWLKAGLIEKGQRYDTNVGTPQGGLISPLLANIALNNLEVDLKKEMELEIGKVRTKTIRVVRYADDFVIMHESKEVIEKCQIKIQKWLAERGLSLSQEKTKIVHTSEGFDFLGFNIRQHPIKNQGRYARTAEVLAKKEGKRAKTQGFKTIIKPSKKAIKEHIYEMGQTIRKMKAVSQENLIRTLNPKIKGWANYYRAVVSKEVYSSIDRWMYQKLRRWSKRRHPTRNGHWVSTKYFRRIGKNKWNFATQTDKLHKYAETKIERHVMVKMGKSFYDGDEVYWAKRLSKGYGDISPSKAKLLKKQNGKCAFCNGIIKNGDLMETHHIISKNDGGTNESSQLALMHKHCHDQYHALYLEQQHNKRKTDKNLALPYRIMSNIQAEIMGVINKIKSAIRKPDKVVS